MSPLLIVWGVTLAVAVYALAKERTLVGVAVVIVTLILFLTAAGVGR